MDRLIVGLGNPGMKYHYTRHNIGWDIFEELSFANELKWTEKFKGHFSVYTFNGEKIYFLKPQTFMNLSGESVQPIMNFFKITIDNILVIHDELDLPFGTIAFKKGGGLAGHNGLKSITASLGTQDFKRVRIGIGRPVHGDVSNWVLSGYTGEDKDFFRPFLKGAAEALEDYIKLGFDKAATTYSKKKIV
ncbi:MAG: aminoacyl-tRNA hydrolase [Bacteriovorax sp.]|nr:aminoacyl-tRNA hydrolase [Bacteriovorax sp.]